MFNFKFVTNIFYTKRKLRSPPNIKRLKLETSSCMRWSCTCCPVTISIYVHTKHAENNIIILTPNNNKDTTSDFNTIHKRDLVVVETLSYENLLSSLIKVQLDLQTSPLMELSEGTKTRPQRAHDWYTHERARDLQTIQMWEEVFIKILQGSIQWVTAHVIPWTSSQDVHGEPFPPLLRSKVFSKLKFQYEYTGKRVLWFSHW